MCLFIQAISDFPFTNLLGQAAIEVSCTFHLEEKIFSCIMYNEICTYCQQRDIAVRDVASFFHLGAQIAFLLQD